MIYFIYYHTWFSRIQFFPAQIWDPFACVCRDVYCPAEFDLTSFTCLNPDGTNGSLSEDPPMTVLPSSEVELTFAILVVDTSIPAPDPPPPMTVLADVITTHFPDEPTTFSLFTESLSSDEFHFGRSYVDISTKSRDSVLLQENFAHLRFS